MAREEGIAACREMRGLWRLCWLVWLVAVVWMPVCCFEHARLATGIAARFAVVRRRKGGWKEGDGCWEARGEIWGGTGD
jgi:hypothetical protein